MEFKQALNLMKKGVPMKLASWGGYWYWDLDKETIMMHTKDGNELDIRGDDSLKEYQEQISNTMMTLTNGGE